MSRTKQVLELNGRKIILIGTAHVSQESIDEVKQEIEQNSPDCIAIELDERRYNSMIDPEGWKKLDIVKVLKRNEGFLLLANLVLGSFQRKMGKNAGIKPGDEMMAAIKLAGEKNIPFTLVDRPIHVTLRRAWAKNSFWGKCKLLASLLASAFDKEEISQEQIESLKTENEMDSMMKELSDYLPKVKEVLIDERDRYLAAHIWESEGDTVLAVLGAGHLPGVQAYLEKMAAKTESTDVSDIASVPPKSTGSKIASWILPAVIIGLIVYGFIYGGSKIGGHMALSWALWNGGLAAASTILALGNPLTVLGAFLSAPITSLAPFIGVGMVTGIIQASIRKPKVEDMETLQDDVRSFKKWYSNRLLHILLIFIFSTLGSSAGTFIAGADIVSLLAKIGIQF